MKLSPKILAYTSIIFIGSAGLTSQAYAKYAVRTVKQADGSTASCQAIVPSAKAAEFGALGYQDTSCTPVKKEANREKFCAPEKFGNNGVQRQLEVLAGASFADLCTAARAEAGLPEQAANQTPAVFSPSNSRKPEPTKGPKAVSPLGLLSVGNTQGGGQ